MRNFKNTSRINHRLRFWRYNFVCRWKSVNAITNINMFSIYIHESWKNNKLAIYISDIFGRAEQFSESFKAVFIFSTICQCHLCLRWIEVQVSLYLHVAFLIWLELKWYSVSLKSTVDLSGLDMICDVYHC